MTNTKNLKFLGNTGLFAIVLSAGFHLSTTALADTANGSNATNKGCDHYYMSATNTSASVVTLVGYHF